MLIFGSSKLLHQVVVSFYMGKKIVLCLDGTGNSFDKVYAQSNVAKLYSSLQIDAGQVGYYHPGVGTMGDPMARTRIGKEWSRLKGLAFGRGLLPNVGDAYRYLMDTYVDGDEIYLFGFSRGAYTARVLASLIHVFGLLCAGNHGLIPYILAMYSKTSRQLKGQKQTFEPDEAFKFQFSHRNNVVIHFCGLWDTVSSYGWFLNPIQLPFLGVNPIIRTGRQAISIHERRCFYRDNCWGKPSSGQDIRQVWFLGVHSDVGGSYREQTGGLSKIALEWMMVEASRAGLQLNEVKAKIVLGKCWAYPRLLHLPAYSWPDRNAKLHESLGGPWWLLEYLPRREESAVGANWIIPRGRSRAIPPDSLIHASVTESKHVSPLPASYTVEPWVVF